MEKLFPKSLIQVERSLELISRQFYLESFGEIHTIPQIKIDIMSDISMHSKMSESLQM
jgi:hypothetical protein